MDFSFIPYSTAAGSLVVPKDSEIRSLQDLAGRRIGTAGGAPRQELAVVSRARDQSGEKDLAETVVPVFRRAAATNSNLNRPASMR